MRLMLPRIAESCRRQAACASWPDAREAVVAGNPPPHLPPRREFSMADIAWCAALERLAANLPVLRHVSLRDPHTHPNLAAWFAGMESRPAYTKGKTDDYTHNLLARRAPGSWWWPCQWLACCMCCCRRRTCRRALPQLLWTGTKRRMLPRRKLFRVAGAADPIPEEHRPAREEAAFKIQRNRRAVVDDILKGTGILRGRWCGPWAGGAAAWPFCRVLSWRCRGGQPARQVQHLTRPLATQLAVRRHCRVSQWLFGGGWHDAATGGDRICPAAGVPVPAHWCARPAPSPAQPSTALVAGVSLEPCRRDGRQTRAHRGGRPGQRSAELLPQQGLLAAVRCGNPSLAP